MAARKNPRNTPVIANPPARANLTTMDLEELLAGAGQPSSPPETVATVPPGVERSPEEGPSSASSEGGHSTDAQNPDEVIYETNDPRDDAFVNLGNIFDEDPSNLKGIFSDEPPPGFQAGHRAVDQPSMAPTPPPPERKNLAQWANSKFPGNASMPAPGVNVPDSGKPGPDEAAVARARASLMEDARAAKKSSEAPYVPPTAPVSALRRGSSHHDVRQSIANAAAKPNNVRYRSRITVGQAYQYDGRLHQAPDYIDRNWAAYDHGPAINVPEVGIVRAGQWIVVQNVLDDDGSVAYTEIKVYDDEMFRSLFMVMQETDDGSAEAA